MVRVWNTEGGNEVERKRQPTTTGLSNVKVFGAVVMKLLV